MNESESRALERGRRRLHAGRAGARRGGRAGAPRRGLRALPGRDALADAGGRRAAGRRRAARAAARAARAGDGRGALRRRAGGRLRRRAGRGRALRPRRRLAARARLRPDGPAAGGRASPPRCWSSPPSPASRSAAGSAPTKAARPARSSPARPPGVTAKVVSEGDSGTLHLANVKQLPTTACSRPGSSATAKSNRCEALFVPDRKGRASTELPDMDGVEVVMVTDRARGRQQVADLGADRHDRRSPVGTAAGRA